MAETSEPKVVELGPEDDENVVSKEALDANISDKENKGDEAGQEQGDAGTTKLNRGEKKCRKAMQKLGMKSITGINRVTLKRNKQVFFIIDKPEVMKSPTSEIYVVFGEAKYEDLSQINAASAASDLTSEKPTEAATIPEKPLEEDEAKEDAPAEDEDEGDEEDLDESGLTPSNIEMVMSHSKVSRSKAVKALRETNDDMLEAILKLTK